MQTATIIRVGKILGRALVGAAHRRCKEIHSSPDCLCQTEHVRDAIYQIETDLPHEERIAFLKATGKTV